MNMLEDTQPNAEVVKNTLKRLKRMSDMITRRPKRTKNAVDRYSEQWSTEEEQAVAVVAIDVKVDDDNPDNATDDDNVTEDLEESSADDNVDDDDDLTAAKAKPAAVSLAPKHDASATKPQSKSETESVANPVNDDTDNGEDDTKHSSSSDKDEYPDYSSTDNDEDDAGQAVESSLVRMHRMLREYDEKHPPPTRPCFKCQVCLIPDCKKCKNCLNKKKYGGPGNWRRTCVEKQTCPFISFNSPEYTKNRKEITIETITAEFSEKMKIITAECTEQIKALEGKDVVATTTGIGLDPFATIKNRARISFCVRCGSRRTEGCWAGDSELRGHCSPCGAIKMGHQKIETVLIKNVAQALSGMTNSFCYFYHIFLGMASPEAALNNPKYRPYAFWHKMSDGPNLRVRIFLECNEKGHQSTGTTSHYNTKAEFTRMAGILDSAPEEDTVSVFVRVCPISECFGKGLKEQCVRVARTMKPYVDGNFKVAKKIVIYHDYNPDNKHLLYTKKNAPDDWVLESYDNNV